MKQLYLLSFLLIGFLFGCQKNDQNYIIKKGNVEYDFTFAELAVKYLESEDTFYLRKIAETDAIKHLQNHAKQFGYNVPTASAFELAKYLMSPLDQKKEILDQFKRNLNYARGIAEKDIPQKIAIQYLPKDFEYSSRLYFTFGYDLGVVYGKNASLNLAHPFYLSHMKEIKYYSIHELHHAGFVLLKNGEMPSLKITTYAKMARIIAYFTHLEGMATYAALEIRTKEHALDVDEDYTALQNKELMNDYKKEFFEIYNYFKNNPKQQLTDKDWEKLSVLSNKKRLWYRVGALMAKSIDKKLGREELVQLISEPSGNFINIYLAPGN